MKRYIALALALVLALSLCACRGTEADAPTEDASMPTILEVNPVQEVDGSMGISGRLGFWLEAPEGAEDCRYSVILGRIGQIQFSLEGTEYSLRASKKEKDISGVYGPFEEEVTQLLIDHPVVRCEGQIRYTTEGGAVAEWRAMNREYSLSAVQIADRESFSSMVSDIAPKIILVELDRNQKSKQQELLDGRRKGHAQVCSGGETFEPYVTVAYGYGGGIAYDSPMVKPEEVKMAELLPCVLYGDDFEVAFTEGGELDHVILYDGEYNRLADRWNLDFSDLSSGTYFVNIIMSESRSGGDYTGYQCVFELIVP